MAYQLEDEEQQPQGVGRAVAGGGRGPQGATRGQTPGRGTGFVNLERVFNLNRPQATSFTQGQVAGADRQARGAQSQGSRVVGDFEHSVMDSTLRGPGTEQWKQAEEGRLEGGMRADAEARAGQEYTGPTDITQASGYADAQGAITRAGERIAELGTQGGREAEAGRRGLNAGESQLSAWLQGRAGGADFDNLASRYSNLASMMGLDGSAAVERGKKAQAQTQGMWRALLGKQDEKARQEQEERDAVEREREAEKARKFAAKGPVNAAASYYSGPTGGRV